MDKRRTASRPGPVDDPRPIPAEQDVQRIEVGVQERTAVEQVQVGLTVDVGGPRCRACFTVRSGQPIAARRCKVSMTRGRSGEPGR